MFFKEISKYLSSCGRFSSLISLSFTARSQLTFFAWNSSQSCFATFSLSPSCLNVASNRLDPEDEVFKQAFRVPLRPLAHFLSRTSSTEAEASLELSRFGLSLFTAIEEGSSVTFKSQFEVTAQMGPVLPSFDRFANQIIGCDFEWFFTLIHSTSKIALKTASMLLLQCIPGSGLRIALPGSEEAQVTLGASQFANFVASQFTPVLISLSEFVSFLNFCKQCERPMDFYFGAAGQPLIATYSSVDGTDCRFIFSTVSTEVLLVPEPEEREVPATDDEDSLDI